MNDMAYIMDIEFFIATKSRVMMHLIVRFSLWMRALIVLPIVMVIDVFVVTRIVGNSLSDIWSSPFLVGPIVICLGVTLKAIPIITDVALTPEKAHAFSVSAKIMSFVPAFIFPLWFVMHMSTMGQFTANASTMKSVLPSSVMQQFSGAASSVEAVATSL